MFSFVLVNPLVEIFLAMTVFSNFASFDKVETGLYFAVIC